MTDLAIESAIVERLRDRLKENLLNVPVVPVMHTKELQGEGVFNEKVLVLFNRSDYQRPGQNVPSINTQSRSFEVAVAVASKNLRASPDTPAGASELKEIVKAALSGWQYDGGLRLFLKNDFLVISATEIGVWMYQINVIGERIHVM